MNPAQQRALTLRDQLQWRATRYLDLLLDGISDPEPTTYKLVDGAVQPPLQLVTLKPCAMSFHIGNVLFTEENNAVYQTSFIFRNGQCELETRPALPESLAVIESIPIHSFIANNMLPLFEDRIEAILARLKQVNDARKKAFEDAMKPAIKIARGKSLARLTTNTEDQLMGSPQLIIDGPIERHVSNTHPAIGLESIPVTAKAIIFNSMPEEVKISLFDNVAQAAFPNFNELMMACWNVVSVYTNVGTADPDLHRSIVQLGHVLKQHQKIVGSYQSQDGSATGRALTTKEEPETLRAPPSLVPASSILTDDRNLLESEEIPAQSTSAAGDTMELAAPGETALTAITIPESDWSTSSSGIIETEKDTTHGAMAPPKAVPVRQNRKASAEGRTEDKGVISISSPTCSTRAASADRSSPLFVPERPTPPRDSRCIPSTPSRHDESPVLRQPDNAIKESVRKGVGNRPNQPTAGISDELVRRRAEYAATLDKTKHMVTGRKASPSLFPSEVTERSKRVITDVSDSEPASDSPAPKKPRRVKDMSLEELKIWLETRKSSCQKLYGTNIPAQQLAEMRKVKELIKQRMDEAAREEDAGAPKAATPPALGTSMLGAKKNPGAPSTAIAPVAQMLPQDQRPDSEDR